ncbi:MAG TPA: formate/nitrite transporter family protein [Acidimicrobiia bacterium]|nr:formate/nitrite transporter family protein [Acidimicrobiia bacterium]
MSRVLEDDDVELQDGGSELTHTFERTVADGEYRLNRSWRNLLATGLVGGLDVGIGILALLIVQAETGSLLLGALAFGIGFIALVLAQSELFTENFLVPVAAVTARRGKVGQLLRLWAGTAATNLAGGWLMTGLIVAGHPDLERTAREIGSKYADLPPGRLFVLSILGGIVITLMTWMERATESIPAKLVVAVSTGFLLIAGTLSHTVVASLVLFAALHAGAPFGYLEWLEVAGTVTAGNLVGGLGLVTLLRLVQVGSRRIEQEQPDDRRS